MRAYFFGNMYLASIQQSIQALHCTSDISVKYDADSDQHSMYEEWAKRHKTVILLNGGFSSDILELNEFFSDENNPYPWAMFCEEDKALNGAPTSIGIILPHDISTFAAGVRKRLTSIVELKTAQSRALGITTDGPTSPNDEAAFEMFSADAGFDVEATLAEYTTFHFELITRLNEYGLAR